MRFPLVGRTARAGGCSTTRWPRVATRHRAAGRDHGRAGHRQDATDGGAARARTRADAPARDVRGVHGVDAVRRLARAPAPAHRASGRTPTTSSSSACGPPSARGTPTCCPGCRCSRSPFEVDMPATRRGRAAGARVPRARGCTRSSCASCATGCASPRCIEIEDAHLMDAASADAARRGSPSTSAVEPVARRRRAPRHGRGLLGAARDRPWRTSSSGRSGRAEALALAEAVTDDVPLPPHVLRLAAERSGGSPQFLRDLLRAVGLRSRRAAAGLDRGRGDGADRPPRRTPTGR